jgi:hypothetical protein
VLCCVVLYLRLCCVMMWCARFSSSTRSSLWHSLVGVVYLFVFVRLCLRARADLTQHTLPSARADLTQHALPPFRPLALFVAPLFFLTFNPLLGLNVDARVLADKARIECRFILTNKLPSLSSFLTLRYTLYTIHTGLNADARIECHFIKLTNSLRFLRSLLYTTHTHTIQLHDTHRPERRRACACQQGAHRVPVVQTDKRGPGA